MTSRNYLFNSIKENIRRNFYLFIYSYNFRFFCGIPVTDNYGIRQGKSNYSYGR